MKKTRILAFLTLCLLLLSAVPFAASAEEAAPTLYFNLTFDDMRVGAIEKIGNLWMKKPDGGTDYLVFFGENVTAIENRWGTNNCATYHKKAGGTDASGFGIMPFNVAMGVGKTLADYKSDFVIQYDLYVDRDDGANVWLLSAKSKSLNKWQSNPVLLNPRGEDGTALMAYKDMQSNQYVTSSVAFTYGKWTRVAAVYHYGESAVTFDFYIDGQVVFTGVTAWFDGTNTASDLFQMTLGKFMNTGTATPADCTLSMDNIRMYAGNRLATDRELDILPGGAQYAGVQFSAVKDAKYGLRLVGTVDSLAYQAVGFDVTVTYIEGNEEKSKTISKNAGSVYDSILATEDGGITAYTAEALGGKYLYALILDGIPTAVGEMTLDISTYSITDGVKTVQSRMRLTVKDGNLISSCYL